MRTLGLRRHALREEAELDPRIRSQLDAYCAGFNAAVASGSGPLPAEFQMLRLDFEPWRPADLLAGAKLLSFGLSTNWERELLRADLVRELGPELAERIDPIYPRRQPGRAEAGRGLRRRRLDPRRARSPSSASRSGWPAPPAGPTTGRSAPSAAQPAAR